MVVEYENWWFFSILQIYLNCQKLLAAMYCCLCKNYDVGKKGQRLKAVVGLTRPWYRQRGSQGSFLPPVSVHSPKPQLASSWPYNSTSALNHDYSCEPPAHTGGHGESTVRSPPARSCMELSVGISLRVHCGISAPCHLCLTPITSPAATHSPFQLHPHQLSSLPWFTVGVGPSATASSRPWPW